MDYDARVLPSAVLLPYTSRLHRALLPIYKEVLGQADQGLTIRAQEQMSLPQCLSGMQAEMPGDIAPLARLAALIENGPKLRAAIRELQPHVDAHDYDEISEEISEVDRRQPNLPAQLCRVSIYVGGYGLPQDKPHQDTTLEDWIRLQSPQ